MLDKQHLRAAMRAARRDFVADLPQATRALILRRLPAPVEARLPDGCTIGLYYATPDEAPTLAMTQWLLEGGWRVALPYFASRAAPMQFCIWDSLHGENDLVAGPYGPQPANTNEGVAPDVLLMPLLGFTAEGARLGQGGGHYDKWLAEHPRTLAIGLGWDMQCLDSLPQEPHDRQMDAVITPTRFYTTRLFDCRP